MNWKAIEEHLESPIAKTIAFVGSTIVAGILSGTFITEITANNAIQWKLFYKSWSFYGLASLSLVVYVYHRFLFARERAVERFADAEFCKAYMMSKCLPEVAERYMKIIRNGQGGDLVRAMDEVRRSLQ